jgi:cold shock protein
MRGYSRLSVWGLVEVPEVLEVVSILRGGSMGRDQRIHQGKIKMTNTEKGFGFIAGEDGREYFFHKTGCGNCRFDQLERGTFVTFDTEDSPKGPRAVDINV